MEQYKSDTGVYPSALEALTPRYLTEIPHTNLAAYPKFEYAAAPNLDALPTAYELYIRTPFGGINWDVFVYWPEGDYPEYMHGGSVERIDDWAYVHE